MFKRFLVFIVLTVVLFVLANTIAHAATPAHPFEFVMQYKPDLDISSVLKSVTSLA